MTTKNPLLPELILSIQFHCGKSSLKEQKIILLHQEFDKYRAGHRQNTPFIKAE